MGDSEALPSPSGTLSDPIDIEDLHVSCKVPKKSLPYAANMEAFRNIPVTYIFQKIMNTCIGCIGVPVSRVDGHALYGIVPVPYSLVAAVLILVLVLVLVVVLE